MFLISCGKSKNNTSEEQIEQIDTDTDLSVIYGPDDRLDYYQITNSAVLELANSSVALVKSSDLRALNSKVQLLGDSFGDDYGLCSTEPYREQITAAFCSGSLIDTDLVLTAGHCVTSVADCAQTKFVFGYSQKTPTQKTYEVASSEVYGCKEIIHTQAVSNGADFALIKLDRVVLNHKPLNLRLTGTAQVGDPLLVIGHPAGLPQKVASGAKVRSVNSGYFVANLDTYGGNSGSPVFNADTGLIEGVLVRGEDDFINQGACAISNHCTDGSCRGEDVTKISEVLKYLSINPAPQPPALNEEVFSSGPLQTVIPDNNKTGISSSINVATTPNGRKVLIKINVLHTWIGDLIVKIISPDGNTITLHNRSGSNQDDIVGTMGADINSYQSLAPLSSVSLSGPWRLQIQDLAMQDIGKLLEWAVIFKN